MNEKSSCPVLRGRDSGNTVLLLDIMKDARMSEIEKALLYNRGVIDLEKVRVIAE